MFHALQTSTTSHFESPYRSIAAANSLLLLAPALIEPKFAACRILPDEHVKCRVATWLALDDYKDTCSVRYIATHTYLAAVAVPKVARRMHASCVSRAVGEEYKTREERREWLCEVRG